VLVRRTANADNDDMMHYMTRCAMDYFEVIKDEPNYLDETWDKRLLQDYMVFNPKETRKSDKPMAHMWCLVCYDVYKNHLLEGQDDEYSNMSNFSTILNALSVQG